MVRLPMMFTMTPLESSEIARPPMPQKERTVPRSTLKTGRQERKVPSTTSARAVWPTARTCDSCLEVSAPRMSLFSAMPREDLVIFTFTTP